MVGYESLLSIANPKTASALFAMTYMALLGFIAVGMYRRGWIVKV
jgi:predicted acyltransferase